MKILFTICGRAGSKGIKNKNIRDFLGKPLPLYTLAAIRLYLDRHPGVEADVALNTDSPELIEILTGTDLGEVIPVYRKEELAGDRVAKRDVIVDTLFQMEEKQQKTYNIVVDLDITSPLRTVADIENLIEKIEKTGCDVVFSAVPSRRNPYFNMVKKGEQGYVRALASNFVTRQEAPEMFDMNASMYAYDAAHLKAGKGVLEGYNEMIEMYDTGILDLDHVHDFELMEAIAAHLYKIRSEFGEIRERL